MAELQNVTTYPAVCGAVLANLRNEIGLHQNEVAARAGIKKSTWSRIEKGESSLSIDQLFFVATALAVDATEIVRRTEIAIKHLGQLGIRIERADQSPTWKLPTMIGLGLIPIVGTPLALLIAGATAIVTSKNGE